jgi:hypothetical protein
MIVPVFGPHQAMPQQNPVDGAGGQPQALPAQQHLQLARSPIRVALAQLNHPLFSFLSRAPRTRVWPPTLFHHPSQSILPIAFQPDISRGPRNPELLAELLQRLLLSARRHHKLHSLLVYVHPVPSHSWSLSRARCARAGV